MKLLIAIIDRRFCDKVINILSNKALCITASLGLGTANSEILDYLGIGETEKEIIHCVVNAEDVDSIFESLANIPEFVARHGGVAFTIPITAIGKKFYEELTQLKDDLMEV